MAKLKFYFKKRIPGKHIWKTDRQYWVFFSPSGQNLGTFYSESDIRAIRKELSGYHITPKKGA